MIKVESVVGQGSTFTVILPLQHAELFTEQGLPRLYPVLSPQNVTSATRQLPIEQQEVLESSEDVILAVDDNPDVIPLIKYALRDLPYTIVGVLDPLLVMEVVNKKHPRAIILDLMMPELNGWQVLHLLKSNLATASIPVIILSVLAEETTGYVLGADDYLVKPFQTETLRRTIEHLIEGKHGTFETSTSEAERMGARRRKQYPPGEVRTEGKI